MPSSAPETPETQTSVRSETAFILQTRRIDGWVDRSYVTPDFKLAEIPDCHRPHCRIIRRMVIDFVEQGDGE